MSMLMKLIEIWVVNKTVSVTTPLVMRLLLGVAMIIFSIVLAALIVAILLGGLVWCLYGVLIAQGYAPAAAILMISGVLLLLSLAVFWGVWCYVHRLHETYLALSQARHPVSGIVSQLSQSFLAGYDAAGHRTSRRS